jgi:hypothetical protein
MYNNFNTSDKYEFEGAEVTSLKMRKDPYVNARILWPALGFPAVIQPRETGDDSDATHCICVLLLSERQYLSKSEAARHLRIVPWAQRSRRYIAAGQAGSFLETDLSVRNDLPFPKTGQQESMKLTMPGWKDNFGPNGASGTGISFGGNRDGENGLTVKLADEVLSFYTGLGLKYLHEIRLSSRATLQLSTGQYQLFWNNDRPGENSMSAEMKLLFVKYAFPRRSLLGNFWNRQHKFLMNEYEFEHGSLHRPYKQAGTPLVRTEILHPLFIQHSAASNLKIGHLTDMHVSVRENVYEDNLRKFQSRNPSINLQFNNWNANFQQGYKSAKSEGDMLLLTGDLIDYGRGHWGLDAAGQVGTDSLYQADRNWFLFYYLLASGDSYQKPVYTILGNHDWRINPYPPFAPGAPGFNSHFHNHTSIPKSEDRIRIMQAAHGPGSERTFSYQIDTRSTANIAWRYIKNWIIRGDLWSRLPLATTADSVKWYLLSINPFLDYSCSLPSGQKLLMLDWGEKEKIFFSAIKDGMAYSALPTDEEATMPGPKAEKMLTGLQKKMVEAFVSSPGNAKIIGMHAPPIAPYSDWTDQDVLAGVVTYDNDKFRKGPKVYKFRKLDGSIRFGHPIYAMTPVADRAHYGMTADFNSFEQNRDWFIDRVTDPKSGVRVILAGHIHRNGLYFLQKLANNNPNTAIAGKTVVNGKLFPPLSSIRTIGLTHFKKEFPLFLNTTSLGPRGSFYTRKLTDAENRNKGLSIDPGYAMVDVTNNGGVNKVEFLAVRIARSAMLPQRIKTTAGLSKYPIGP